MIRKIDVRTNRISKVAGRGTNGFSGDDGLAVQAELNGPEGVFADDNGNIYIADTGNERIRKVDSATGIITTIAGNGEAGFSGDGGNARKAKLNRPSGVVADSDGNVYFNDYGNDRIRRVDKDGIISTLAGTGEPGFTGDGGQASQATINDVYGLAMDKNNNLYFVDSLNFAIRKVDLGSGIISTICGKGKPGKVEEFVRTDRCYLGGFAHPKGTTGGKVAHALDVTKEGYIVLGDTGVNRIRVIDPYENQVYTVVGNGEDGDSKDEGNALNARINVHGVRVDSENNLYFIDFFHNVIRKVVFTK